MRLVGGGVGTEATGSTALALKLRPVWKREERDVQRVIREGRQAWGRGQGPDDLCPWL